jgi:hypothetical protein
MRGRTIEGQVLWECDYCGDQALMESAEYYDLSNGWIQLMYDNDTWRDACPKCKPGAVRQYDEMIAKFWTGSNKEEN